MPRSFLAVSKRSNVNKRKRFYFRKTFFLVEAARRYTNTPGLPDDLARATKKLLRSPWSTRPLVRAVDGTRLAYVHNIYERLGSEIIASLIAEYEAGVPSTTLARTYGLAKATVLKLLHEQGVEFRNKRMTQRETELAVRLYQSGWSLARVGDHLHRDPTAIRSLLERRGIKRRGTNGETAE